jgi:hypothetical protein
MAIITHRSAGVGPREGAARSRALGSDKVRRIVSVCCRRRPARGGCYDTIQTELDPVVVLPNFCTAMREMYLLRRHGLGQHRMQLAMKDVVGAPELV